MTCGPLTGGLMCRLAGFTLGPLMGLGEEEGSQTSHVDFRKCLSPMSLFLQCPY